jgi:hypothetical protein
MIRLRKRMPVALKLIHADDRPGHDPTTPTRPRHSRRLTDKILIAFHHACDQGDIEVAEELLAVLGFMIRRTRRRWFLERRTQESLVAAHERLWLLRHPESLGC